MGTGGIAAGGSHVMSAFKRQLKRKGIKADIKKHCSVHKVGCRGLCAKDVLVDVIHNNVISTYQFVKPDMAKKIIEEHIANNNPVQEWLVSEDYRQFNDKQIKVVLSDCGIIDPEDINSYVSTGGYDSLRQALFSMSPSEIIENIKASGLRGRGGAGFSTGLKWEFTRKAAGTPKYVICNADEGDPGAFMDRSIIEGNPHSVIEGMIIGAYAIGSDQGYVYIRAEYPLAVERLRKALNQARKKKFLGKNILGTKFSFDIRVKLGAGAFVCGESTALMFSIEGKRGMPRVTPPRSTESGLWKRPTCLNNVETFANVPYIIRNGPEWYASFGTEKSKGTKVFALTGKIRNSGLIEVPMGIRLREIIYEIGGGIENNKALKAVQTGGPSGGCIPAELLDISVDYESLAKVGSIVGSGGMVVLDEDDCMVNIAKFFLQFTQSESCGKCTPCRIGTKRLLEILERITSGKGRDTDIELLLDLSADVKVSSLCGLGQSSPNPVLTTIKFFRDEYEAHIREKKCPSHVCKQLVSYYILEELCKGCGACIRACPADAITGERKKTHFINAVACIKCGGCLDACKFKAVSRG
jgi:NADH-quinone oxidoreductase subunit F